MSKKSYSSEDWEQMRKIRNRIYEQQYGILAEEPVIVKEEKLVPVNEVDTSTKIFLTGKRSKAAEKIRKQTKKKDIAVAKIKERKEEIHYSWSQNSLNLIKEKTKFQNFGEPDIIYRQRLLTSHLIVNKKLGLKYD